MRCGQIPDAPEHGFVEPETGSFFGRNREFIYPNRELPYSDVPIPKREEA
jgi:hypothetical protein